MSNTHLRVAGLAVFLAGVFFGLPAGLGLNFFTSERDKNFRFPIVIVLSLPRRTRSLIDWTDTPLISAACF